MKLRIKKKKSYLDSFWFISLITLGFLAPRGIAGMAQYSGGVQWQLGTLIFAGLKYVGVAVILCLIILHKQRIGYFVCGTILYCVLWFWSEAVNGGVSIDSIQMLVTIVGLVLVTNFYCKIGRINSFLTTISFWLGLFVVINFLTIVAFPGGMYVDDRGWGSNYFLGYDNLHLYSYLPFLCSLSIVQIENRGKLSIGYYLMLLVVVLSTVVTYSATSMVIILMYTAALILIKDRKLPGFINPKNIFLISIAISVGLIVFHIQEDLAPLLSKVFPNKQIATMSSRVIIWDNAMKSAMDNWLLGNGAKAISGLNWTYEIVQCHNRYLDMLYVGGFPLLCCFLMILRLCCRAMGKSRNKYLKNIIIFAMACYAVNFIVESRRDDALMFIIMTLANNINDFHVTEKAQS